MKTLMILSVFFSMMQVGFSNIIEIKDFSLIGHNGVVDVTWSCEVYDEVYLFIIEKSDGLTMFSPIDTLYSKPGNESYLYRDDSPGSGLCYYKVRCIEMNGAEAAFGISYIDVSPSTQNEAFKISLFPMPFVDNINLTVECEENTVLTISCHDLDGKLLFDTSKSCNKGCNTFKFDEWINLKDDNYYLTVSDGHLNTKTTHMIKNR